MLKLFKSFVVVIDKYLMFSKYRQYTVSLYICIITTYVIKYIVVDMVPEKGKPH